MVTMDAARTQWSSAEVLTGVTRLAAEGRAVTADLIALLAVLDERRLFEADGCGSLFEFCVTRLRLSESQAYHRIQAARAAARFPVILDRLREGTVTLTSIALLRSVLTEANHAQLLADAAGRSKREVEGLVRLLTPLPDVRLSIRRLAPCPTPVAAPLLACDRRPASVTAGDAAPGSPEPLGGGIVFDAENHAPCSGDLRVEADSSQTGGVRSGAATTTTLVSTQRPEIRPLAPARYSLRLTISEETRGKLRRCQDLLGHAVPDGDPAAVLDRALTLLVAQLERRRFAAKTHRSVASRPGPSRPRRRPSSGTPTRAAAAPADSAAITSEAVGRLPDGAAGGAAAAAARPRSRHIPAAVRRAVWARDEGCCGYVGHGGRCIQTRRLEFHHRVPFADGGTATVENLSLRCRAHNGTEARRWCGEEGPVGHDSDRTELAHPAGRERETGP